jgi:hypothetical protein
VIIRANIIVEHITVDDKKYYVEGVDCPRFRVIYAGAVGLNHVEVDDGVDPGECEVVPEDDLIVVHIRKMWADYPVTEPEWVEVG